MTPELLFVTLRAPVAATVLAALVIVPELPMFEVAVVLLDRIAVLPPEIVPLDMIVIDPAASMPAVPPVTLLVAIRLTVLPVPRLKPTPRLRPGPEPVTVVPASTLIVSLFCWPVPKPVLPF